MIQALSEEKTTSTMKAGDGLDWELSYENTRCTQSTNLHHIQSKEEKWFDGSAPNIYWVLPGPTLHPLNQRVGRTNNHLTLSFPLDGELTFRCPVDREPQLEPVRVVDLNLLQLRSQQDVFLSLLPQKREKCRVVTSTSVC